MHQPDITQQNIIPASEASARLFAAAEGLCRIRPRIHCLTNAVTMNDVANILLAAGGSAIMAQSPAEAAEITEICHGTLLNTGTPSDEKFTACELAGARANKLGHPVVLDPVGVGASAYRRGHMQRLLSQVHPDLIRCNLEEAVTLLSFAKPPLLSAPDFQSNADSKGYAALPDRSNAADSSVRTDRPFPEQNTPSAAADIPHGGVESGIDADTATRCKAAVQLANAYHTAVLISGSADIVSDGSQTAIITGGDARSSQITGSGCMLSALCALFLCTEKCGCDAALNAAVLWKAAAEYAGYKTGRSDAGLGSFHTFLFDAVSLDTKAARFTLCKAPS